MERERKKIQFDVIGCPSWSFSTNRWLCKGRRCRQVGNAASDCLRPLVRRFLSIPQPIFRTRQTQKEKIKTKKVKYSLFSLAKRWVYRSWYVCAPPVTRYAGAKEENRQKRIWFSFGVCVCVHTISWRRGQDRRRVILLLRWWKPRCWACIPVFLHPSLLSVYVYSSKYISTVKSAIDGVDIDVVCVCSAGKEVRGERNDRARLFQFPRLRGAVFVCIYKGESPRTRCEPKGSRDQKLR